MEEFKSLDELYRKLLPAFKVKINDLKRNKITNIEYKDIWEYLKDNNWKYRSNLTLGEMVNDIINVSELDITNYKIKKG